MFRIIEDLPEDVLGIGFHGKITHEDYVDGFIPLFEEKLEKHNPLRILTLIHPDFEGFEIAAMWDDATYGLKHWRDISHIAVVCDGPIWIKSSVALFAPFFPGEVRSFDMAEMGTAREWISAPDSIAA